MALGKSTMVDYERIKQAFKAGSGVTTEQKVIPLGSTVSLDVPISTPAGVEFNVIVEPDDGFVFDIAYFKLTVPDYVEANILLTTDAGDSVVFADNVTQGEYVIDSSNFKDLAGIRKITLYVKTTTDVLADVTVSLEYAGRQVTYGGGEA